MKPTLASMRAKALKEGKVIPIFTEDEWLRNKEERLKPLDLTPLLDSYARYHATTRKLEDMFGREVARNSEPQL